MSNSNTNNNMQANPFWDFVASMQDPRNGRFPAGGPPEGGPQGEGFDPFQGNFGWGPFGQMPYRGKRHEHGGPRGNRSPPPAEHERDESAGPPGPPGPRHGHGHHGRRGPPPHHQGEHPPPPPPAAFGASDDKSMSSPPPADAEDPPSRAPTPPTPPTEPHGPHGHGRHGHGPHRRGSPGPHGHGSPGHGPGRRGGRFGMRGGHGHGPGPHAFGGSEGRGHGHGPHGHGSRGPRGPRGFGGSGHRHRGRGGPGGPGQFPFDLSSLVEAFAPGLFGGNNGIAHGSNDDGNFHPDLDLFDTVEAYILHLSLPGAKKSDISTTYSSARNSVTVSGVVTRPGVDEEMMGTLALDERRVGAFEREIRLEEGVKIDEDGIAAKLEDGVLRVTVPKVMDEDEYVDIKRIELD